jgi:hypothetical protein
MGSFLFMEDVLAFDGAFTATSGSASCPPFLLIFVFALGRSSIVDSAPLKTTWSSMTTFSSRFIFFSFPVFFSWLEINTSTSSTMGTFCAFCFELSTTLDSSFILPPLEGFGGEETSPLVALDFDLAIKSPVGFFPDFDFLEAPVIVCVAGMLSLARWSSGRLFDRTPYQKIVVKALDQQTTTNAARLGY